MTTRELLARLIRCEAEGEGEDGMKAVATVCMNRVHVAGGEYLRTAQGDLRRVIEQPCQFTCCKSRVAGSDNPQNVWTKSPEPVHYRIADWALDGNVHSGVGNESLWYMNPFSSQCPNKFPYNGSGYWLTRVNQHCFYNPTNMYWDT